MSIKKDKEKKEFLEEMKASTSRVLQYVLQRRGGFCYAKRSLELMFSLFTLFQAAVMKPGMLEALKGAVGQTFFEGNLTTIYIL